MLTVSEHAMEERHSLDDGSPVLPFWPASDYSFVSLLTMLENYAWIFVKLNTNLSMLQYFNYDNDPQRTVPMLEYHLNEAEEYCKRLNLDLSVVMISRIRNNVLTKNFEHLSDQFSRLRERVDDEIRLRLFMYIPIDKVEYYRATNLFGEHVSEKFQSMSDDISESGKCFATKRNTACVFHLMRVMECGLRVLGKSLNDPSLDPRKNPTWDRILKKCDAELQLPHDKRTPEWQRHPQFFADATANLRAVKDAWRNPTLHVEQFYDEEKTLDVWNAVKAFIRHLATVLSD